jgi:hypothetical protein
MPRFVLLTAVVLLCSLTTEAAAQRRPQAQSPVDAQGGVTLTISAKIAGKEYQASGAGSCRHAPEASIRGVSASLWMVQYGGGKDGGIKRLNLTLWRPKDGGSDQVSLDVETKSSSHRVDIGGEEERGEATVAILPNGPGGRLEIRGKDAEGKPMQVTIDCPAFAGVEAEGG